MYLFSTFQTSVAGCCCIAGNLFTVAFKCSIEQSTKHTLACFQLCASENTAFDPLLYSTLSVPLQHTSIQHADPPYNVNIKKYKNSLQCFKGRNNCTTTTVVVQSIKCACQPKFISKCK